jgi:hypothetical protein
MPVEEAFQHQKRLMHCRKYSSLKSNCNRCSRQIELDAMVEPGHEFDHGAMTLQATRDLEDRGAGRP